MYFTRSSKKTYTREEIKRGEVDEYNYVVKPIVENSKRLATLLLDSSLITPSQIEFYDTKIIKCGKYVQIYRYQDRRNKKIKDIEKIKKNSINDIKNLDDIKKVVDIEKVMYDITRVDTDNLIKIENNKKEKKEIILKKIEERNINRSKFQLQRIVKSNEDLFTTFITLTFANFKKIEIDNKDLFYWLPPNNYMPVYFIVKKNNNFKDIVNYEDFKKKIENFTSISKANEKFDNWRSNFKKRLKNDFIYVCVPEFQQNGTVHYHLLTNINYTDFNLLSKDELKKYRPKEREWTIFRTLKSWKYGFSNVLDIKNMNVVGYMSKYMTKDIDNRLFGHRRYLCSQCLSKPSTIYLDSEIKQSKIDDLINNSSKTFNNLYSDNNGLVIEYCEYLLNDELVSINIEKILNESECIKC